MDFYNQEYCNGMKCDDGIDILIYHHMCILIFLVSDR